VRRELLFASDVRMSGPGNKEGGAADRTEMVVWGGLRSPHRSAVHKATWTSFGNALHAAPGNQSNGTRCVPGEYEKRRVPSQDCG
jgi:hypothetical protein